MREDIEFEKSSLIDGNLAQPQVNKNNSSGQEAVSI